MSNEPDYHSDNGTEFKKPVLWRVVVALDDEWRRIDVVAYSSDEAVAAVENAGYVLCHPRSCTYDANYDTSVLFGKKVRKKIRKKKL